MEGHRRREGMMLCPSSSSILPSPPDSPTPSTRNLPLRPAILPEIVIPNDVEVYRRPNPNWVDPALIPPPPPPSYIHDSDSGNSVVSTVLLDDGSSIKTSEEDDDATTDDENDSVIEAALGTSVPLASIFSTPKEDIADLRKAASEIGLHTSLMRRPGASGGKASVNRHGQREHSWWVVMGRNAAAVRHLANVQQQGMPGFYMPDMEVEPVVGRSSSLGFLQVVLAGAIGGAAVLFGMARVL